MPLPRRIYGRASRRSAPPPLPSRPPHRQDPVMTHSMAVSLSRRWRTTSTPSPPRGRHKGIDRVHASDSASRDDFTQAPPTTPRRDGRLDRNLPASLSRVLQTASYDCRGRGDKTRHTPRLQGGWPAVSSLNQSHRSSDQKETLPRAAPRQRSCRFQTLIQSCRSDGS